MGRQHYSTRPNEEQQQKKDDKQIVVHSDKNEHTAGDNDEHTALESEDVDEHIAVKGGDNEQTRIKIKKQRNKVQREYM